MIPVRRQVYRRLFRIATVQHAKSFPTLQTTFDCLSDRRGLVVEGCPATSTVAMSRSGVRPLGYGSLLKMFALNTRSLYQGPTETVYLCGKWPHWRSLRRLKSFRTARIWFAVFVYFLHAAQAHDGTSKCVKRQKSPDYSRSGFAAGSSRH